MNLPNLQVKEGQIEDLVKVCWQRCMRKRRHHLRKQGSSPMQYRQMMAHTCAVNSIVLYLPVLSPMRAHAFPDSAELQGLNAAMMPIWDSDSPLLLKNMFSRGKSSPAHP